MKEQIEDFPEKFTFDELADRLILIKKVKRGLSQSEKGEVFSDVEIEGEIKKWFNSSLGKRPEQ